MSDNFWDTIWDDQYEGRTVACPTCNLEGDAYFIPSAEALSPECAVCDGTHYVVPAEKAVTS